MIDKNELLKEIKEIKEQISDLPNFSGWDSDRAYGYYNIGLIYSKLEDYNSAIDNFNKAIKYHAEYGDAYFELGKIYLKQDNFEKAMNCFKKALEIHPDKKDFQKQIDELEEKYGEIFKKKETFKINLETCSKEEISTLSGFNETKSNEFIEKRNNGKMWYKLDNFIEEFNLSPYDSIKIANRIVFPIKKTTKTLARKFDL